MVAGLQLKQDRLAQYRRACGWTTDRLLANQMGMDKACISRVLKGQQKPGEKFVACLVAAFPGASLDDLWEVVPRQQAHRPK